MDRSETTYPLVDLELARKLERTEGTSCARFVAARAQVFPEAGGTRIEVAGTQAMFDGAGSPMTQTFGLGMLEPVAAEQLDRLERFYFERQSDVDHEVSPLAGVELLSLLCERDYRPIELTSVMYRPIWRGLALAGNTNDQLSVRRVEPADDAVWARTAADGWSEAGDFSQLMLELAQAMRLEEQAASFLVECRGEPIAAGGLSLVENVALLAGASTVPAARKQGAQLALLEHRLRYAAEQGCELAMMCAAPGSASQRNAERHGFRIAYTRTKWRLKHAENRPRP